MWSKRSKRCKCKCKRTVCFNFKLLICCSTFLNLTHLLKETLNRQLRQIMILQKGHDLLFTYPTDFVLENCKSNCDHFIVNNMFCCIGFKFFVCLILLFDCCNSFWMVCFLFRAYCCQTYFQVKCLKCEVVCQMETLDNVFVVPKFKKLSIIELCWYQCNSYYVDRKRIKHTHIGVN